MVALTLEASCGARLSHATAHGAVCADLALRSGARGGKLRGRRRRPHPPRLWASAPPGPAAYVHSNTVSNYARKHTGNSECMTSTSSTSSPSVTAACSVQHVEEVRTLAIPLAARATHTRQAHKPCAGRENQCALGVSAQQCAAVRLQQRQGHQRLWKQRLQCTAAGKWAICRNLFINHSSTLSTLLSFASQTNSTIRDCPRPALPEPQAVLHLKHTSSNPIILGLTGHIIP